MKQCKEFLDSVEAFRYMIVKSLESESQVLFETQINGERVNTLARYQDERLTGKEKHFPEYCLLGLGWLWAGLRGKDKERCGEMDVRLLRAARTLEYEFLTSRSIKWRAKVDGKSQTVVLTYVDEITGEEDHFPGLCSLALMYIFKDSRRGGPFPPS